MNRLFARPSAFVAGGMLTLALLMGVNAVTAQSDVNTTPSRQAIEEASRNGCDGVSEVVRRCADRPEPLQKVPTDPADKARAATKEALDRNNERAKAAAVSNTKNPESAQGGGAQRLDAVNVEGTGDKTLSIEEVLQRALNPGQSGVPGPNGTVSHFAPDGTRYDCIQKCVGPACCATVRSLPNPARDSNSIGR